MFCKRSTPPRRRHSSPRLNAGTLLGLVLLALQLVENPLHSQPVVAERADACCDKSQAQRVETQAGKGLDVPDLRIDCRRSGNGVIVGVDLRGQLSPLALTFPTIGKDEIEELVKTAPQLQELHLRLIVASQRMLQPLKDAPKLRTLYLAHCKSLSASDLTDIPSTVEWLRIDGNLDSADAIPIEHLPGLKVLHLSGLPLEDRSYRFLRTLSSLEEFTCTNCSGFSDQTVRYLEGKKRLRRVHLVDVPVSDRSLMSLAANPHLEYLWLPGSVTDAGLRHLASSQSLATLGLQGPRITGRCARPLAALKGLRHLHLLVTAVDDSGLAELGRLSRLQSLELFGCTAITDVGVAQFAKVSRVKELSFMGSPIGDDGLWALRNIAGLKSVNVTLSNVTKEAAAAFKQTVPSVSVFTNEDLAEAAEKHYTPFPWTSTTIRFPLDSERPRGSTEGDVKCPQSIENPDTQYQD